MAILHSLTDHRRALYLDRAGEVVDTLLLSSEVESVRRSTIEFTKLVRRRLPR